jgi:hypothetical protein
MTHIGRMSDREKHRTRGGYYLITRQPDKAIEAFNQLVAAYPADSAGLANLAVAHFFKRDMAKALTEGRKAVALSPKNVPQRNNVGLYAMYAGDFETAIREQQEVLKLNPGFSGALVGLALSQLGLGRPEEHATWKRLGDGAQGASQAALGLADIASTGASTRQQISSRPYPPTSRRVGGGGQARDLARQPARQRRRTRSRRGEGAVWAAGPTCAHGQVRVRPRRTAGERWPSPPSSTEDRGGAGMNAQLLRGRPRSRRKRTCRLRLSPRPRNRGLWLRRLGLGGLPRGARVPGGTGGLGRA